MIQKAMKKLYFTLVALALAATAVVAKADPAETWAKECAKCHGADGKGETKMGKKLEIINLTDAQKQASFTDEQAFKAIKEGVKDGEKVRMKAAEGLTDAQIKELVKFVRAFKK